MAQHDDNNSNTSAVASSEHTLFSDGNQSEQLSPPSSDEQGDPSPTTTTIVHPLVSEWRCGYDQLMLNQQRPNLNHDDGDDENSTTTITEQTFQDFIKFRKMKSTSLSPNVYNLLHLFNMERLKELLTITTQLQFGGNHSQQPNDDDALIDEYGFLNLNCKTVFNLSSTIQELEDGSNEFFHQLARQIQPLAMLLHEHCFALTESMLRSEQQKNEEIYNSIQHYRQYIVHHVDFEQQHLNDDGKDGPIMRNKQWKWNQDSFFNHFKDSFADFMCVAYPRQVTFNILQMALEEHFNGRSLIALSLLVPLLERGLQDSIYIDLLHKNENSSKIQQFEDFQKLPKFSELLSMPELIEIYGIEVSLLLRALVGPLNSINLRNVSLHGFIQEREFQDCFMSLILLVIPSLGRLSMKHLEETIGREKASLKRPIIDLSNCKPVQEIFKVNPPPTSGLLLDVQDMNESADKWQEMSTEMDQLFEHSLFILHNSIPLWKRAIFVEYFKNQNYYKTLTILFPLFEHSIRRIFVCVNKDCANRLLTAEKNSLYTTLDVLFTTKAIPSYGIDRNALLYSSGDGDNENGGKEVIGGNLLNSIFDLLIWVESPRVRDLIAHGNVNIETIPKELVDEIVKLMLALIHKFDIRHHVKKNFEIRNQDSQFSKILTICQDYFNTQYTSPFHSMSLLDRQLASTLSSLHSLNFHHQEIPSKTFNLPNFNEIREQALQQDAQHEKLIQFLLPSIDEKLLELIEFVKKFYNIEDEELMKNSHLEKKQLYSVTCSDRAVSSI